MTMRTYSFYHAESGEIASQIVQCLPERLASMAPQGYAPIEGRHSAGIRAIVRATAEAEESTAKLDNALKSSSVAAELSLRRLEDYAGGLSRVTTFSGGAVKEVESLLLSFRGLSGEAVLKATSAVLDLSTRMGTDLRSAAVLVGKALADPEKGLTALARAGVVFSESQKASIKSLVDNGRAAQAQGIILAELEKRFGGAAEAARNTFGGALKGVENAFGDLLEARDGMPAATRALNALAETLNKPEVKQGFDNLIAVLSKAVELSARAGAGLTKFGDRVGEVAARFFVAGRPDLTAAEALRLSLQTAEEIYTRKKVSGFFTDEQLAQERAYIETLKERLKLAETANQRRLEGLQPVKVTAQRLPEIAAAAAPTFESQESTLIARQKALTASIATNDFFFNDIERRAQAVEAIQKRTKEANDKIIASNQEQIDQEIQRHFDAEEQKTRAVQEHLEARLALEQSFAAAKQSIDAAVFWSGVGFLEAMAGKSKAVAKALILINRARAIAQTIQNVQAAMWLAQATLPPPTGQAVAAALAVRGAISVGLIAATGALEIASLNTGGGGAGSFAGGATIPNSVASSTTEQAPAGAQQRRQINITVEGVMTRDAARAIAEAIKDVVDNSDVHLFSPNSAQAEAIRQGQ